MVQPDDIGNDILNDINTTINTITGDPGNGGSFGSTGPGGTTPPEDGPNSLTNGSGGQYQDGAPPNNPPAGAGGTTFEQFQRRVRGRHRHGRRHGIDQLREYPAPVSAAKLIKNAKSRVGIVPPGWGKKGNKIPDPGASSKAGGLPLVNNSSSPTNPETLPIQQCLPQTRRHPARARRAGGGLDDIRPRPRPTPRRSTTARPGRRDSTAATDAPATSSAAPLGGRSGSGRRSTGVACHASRRAGLQSDVPQSRHGAAGSSKSGFSPAWMASWPNGLLGRSCKWIRWRPEK